jgi:hypothetical protein
LWKVKKVDYIAFLAERFSDGVFDVFEQHPDFLQRIMLYDIDHGLKLGNATSSVFSEFERFFEEEYGVRVTRVSTHQSHVGRAVPDTRDVTNTLVTMKQ